MENMGILHPESHVLFNQGITRHDPEVVEEIMTQISIKSGFKRWGNKCGGAIYPEMNQIHMIYTLLLLQWKNMSHAQKKKTLESHLFSKEKRYGTTKEKPQQADKSGDI